MLLLALGVFQLWLWGTRIVNLLGETGSFSAAFIAVHLVLYATAIGAGLLLLWLGTRHLVEVRSVTSNADHGTADTDPPTPTPADTDPPTPVATSGPSAQATRP